MSQTDRQPSFSTMIFKSFAAYGVVQKMTTAQVVETSVIVNNNSPIQD